MSVSSDVHAWIHHRTMQRCQPMPMPRAIPTPPNDQTPLRTAIRLFLLLRLGALDLGRTAEGLLSVLALLACDVSDGDGDGG
jgi:hypothetical protein